MQVLTNHQGRGVRLTDERLTHILEHPEMAGMTADIARALVDPDLVLESRADPEVQLFYRFLPTTRVGPKFIVIVVKTKADDSFIVTAYLTDKPKVGRMVWSRER